MSKKQKHPIRVIGRREFINFPELGIERVEAKVDTGAYTSSLHCENISLSYENSQPILYFTIGVESPRVYRFEQFDRKKIKNSFGEMEERFVIRTLFRIAHKQIWSTISLSNRDNMRYPVLIGRRLLKGKFLIDVSHIHTGGVTLRHADQLFRKT